MIKTDAVSKFYFSYRLYIFPIIVGLSSLILIIFVVYPQTVKLIQNQKKEAESVNKYKFLEVKAQTLDSLDLEDLNRKVSFAINAYPTDKDFVSAFALLQNLTTQSGFNTLSISLGSGISKEAGGKSYNLKLDVLGPSSLLPMLLSNIENSPRLIRVSSVEAAAIGKDPKGVNISLSVDLLYSSALADFGSTDSHLPELSQQDEEAVAKLVRASVLPSTKTTTPIGPVGPRGKENPFE